MLVGVGCVHSQFLSKYYSISPSYYVSLQSKLSCFPPLFIVNRYSVNNFTFLSLPGLLSVALNQDLIEGIFLRDRRFQDRLSGLSQTVRYHGIHACMSVSLGRYEIGFSIRYRSSSPGPKTDFKKTIVMGVLGRGPKI